MYGQYKINGLRCIVTAYTQNDMFKPVRLRFQSREGLTWHTLNYLEDICLLLSIQILFDDMINGFAALDGEFIFRVILLIKLIILLKMLIVLKINFIQFWCYDIYDGR